MINLATIVETNAREYPDKRAIVAGEWHLSYRKLNEAANQVANGLRAAGIHEGDKVALSCPTNPYFPICYYGILKAGGVVVPLNILLKAHEVRHHLSHSDSRAYVCFEGSEQLPMGQEGWAAFREVDTCKDFWLIPATPQEPCTLAGAKSWADLIEGQAVDFEAVQRGGDDTCSIIYTSGTTGHAKGAALTHANLLVSALICKDLIHFRSEDVGLIVLPLFHGFGHSAMMNPGLSAGATLVLLPRFDPVSVWQAMIDYDVTVFAGVSTMYWELLRHRDDLTSSAIERIAGNWRIGLSSGSAMPSHLIDAFQRQFDTFILEMYALSEVPPVSHNRFRGVQKPGSVGLPVWGCEVRLVDGEMNDVPAGEGGEIVVRGAHVMKGYHENARANREAFRGGWFHTGDVGRFDDEGFLFVVDRIKDVIIRGGQNVYPREVEEILIAHPEVSLVSVIGIADERYGEDVAAFVVLESGSKVTAEEITAWAKERMAAYAYPRRVRIMQSLPQGPTGKISKLKLRALCAADVQE